MKELTDFVEISKYAGERFDISQAGGGNSSVKLANGEMVIKASGFSLSEMGYNSGYSRVITDDIAKILENKVVIEGAVKREREEVVSKLLYKGTLEGSPKPSIETILHSLLAKYTLHTHPVAVNIITAQINWRETLSSIFKNKEMVFVSYKTPGIELAIELKRQMEVFQNTPKIIFLQNHGLIISSDDKDYVIDQTEHVLKNIEKYLNIDLSRYKSTTELSNLLRSIRKHDNISYFSEDAFLKESLIKNRAIFLKRPFCPDSLVYCGMNCVEIYDFADATPVKNYLNQHGELPKVIICEDNVFFIAPSVKKAKEIEEVFKFHIMVLSQNSGDVNFLNLEELLYLSNWEAEKYRQKL